MSLSKRSEPYIIPEYNLTGDLISYISCGLQYRYHIKGSLPQSTPVQLWFGEFIHSFMEEAYLEWNNDKNRRFPWDWATEIRRIEFEINKRLEARGIYPPPNLFCRYDSSETNKRRCSNKNHPHEKIASKRVRTAINTWGKALFPLIEDAEVKMKGIRNMPDYQEGISRSNYYGINGVVDVISSVKLNDAPEGNLILTHIQNNNELQDKINALELDEYEMIIDYKGMRRPSLNSIEWKYHLWQMLTYAWLRSQQTKAKEIVACILFYFNELEPSKEDMKEFKRDIKNEQTDIMPIGADLNKIKKWRVKLDVPKFSVPFKESRSIRIIPVESTVIQESLLEFDNVVSKIENCILSETEEERIISSWNKNPLRRRCTACDFKHFCPESSVNYNSKIS